MASRGVALTVREKIKQQGWTATEKEKMTYERQRRHYRRRHAGHGA